MSARTWAGWLPREAAEYAKKLSREPDLPHSVLTAETGDLEYNNDLSRRVLCDSRMKVVWEYFDQQNLHERFWADFLREVQYAAKGLRPVDEMSPGDHKENREELAKHFDGVRRIARRYGVDLSAVPVGAFFVEPELEEHFDNLDDEQWSERWTETHGNGTPIDDYFRAFSGWLERQQPLVQRPKHPGAPYQYFVRRLYAFFSQNFDNPKKWEILSVISSVSLNKQVTAEKVRGTCDIKP